MVLFIADTVLNRWLRLSEYELPRGEFPFHYMELALEKKLTRKLNDLRDALTKTKGSIKYDWSGVECIRSKEEFQDWRDDMGYDRRRDDGHARSSQVPQPTCYWTFMAVGEPD